MVEGVEGKRVKLNVRAVLNPQVFDERTLKVPLVKLPGMLNEMLVPLLAVIVQPAGAVH
jgi:hypothetical protein